MKNKIVIALATLFGVLAFFNTVNVQADSQSDIQADIQKQISDLDKTSQEAQKASDDMTNSHQVNNGNGQNIDVGQLEQNVGRDPNEISAQVIKQHLNANDMDWVNNNILQNYQMYYQSAGITDVSGNVAHTLSDLFQNINTNVIYALVDEGLARLFNLATISDGTNNILAQISRFNQNVWTMATFRELISIAFVSGVVWAFIAFAKDIKRLFFSFLIFIIGSVWVLAGGSTLTAINNYTSVAQTTVFQATSNTNQNNVTDTGTSFEKAVRHQYFVKAVERPFYLGNFGVTSADQVKQEDGDPYKLLGSKSSGKVKQNFSNQKYMKAGSSYSWLQATIAFMSPAVSTAYAVPYLGIGIYNMLLQLGAILLYFIAPFVALLSLIPKYSGMLMKTVAKAVGLLVGKIVLLFGIVFVNWTGDLVDVIVPAHNSASAMLNSLLFITLMVALWKKKGTVANLIAGNSTASNMANAMSLSAPIKKGGGVVKGALSSYVGNRLANRRKNPEEEEEEQNQRAADELRKRRIDSYLDEQEHKQQQEQQEAGRERRLADGGLVNRHSTNNYGESEEGSTGQRGRRSFETNDSQKPEITRRDSLLNKSELRENAQRNVNNQNHRSIDLEKDLKTTDHQEQSGVPD
ncbi:CD3337/EF1877 family mobilome membrane protein [Fructobacillus cardui]|uniref:CD3337/EF1877 family mobilome membrane protein n=1 Tax=Fructobacillus cardui TaxID=2893170 RepID=UPI002DB24157|nr:COG5644 [Fructobacillus cardui]